MAGIDLRPLRQDAGLAVWEHRGQSDRLVLSFSGIGAETEPVPPPEFMATASANGRDSVLFIADPQRSWLNRPGLIGEITDIVTATRRARPEIRHLGAIGHSMGGFAALVLAGRLGAANVLALSPQDSVHPDLAGDDPRWMNYRDRIAQHCIRRASDHLSPDVSYTVIYGRHPREAPQRDRLARPPNMQLFVMARTNHNTAARLKSAGLLVPLAEAALSGQRRRIRQIMIRQARAQLRPADPV